MASDQMFATNENGVPDPLRYDGHVDAPQEVALCWQTLRLARNAEIIGIEADLRRGAAAEILSEKCWQSTSELGIRASIH